MSTTARGRLGRFGPYLVVVPFLAIIFTFYGQFLPFGVLGWVGGAVVGGLLGLGLGVVAGRVGRRDGWRVPLANASVFLGAIAIGLMIGGGYLYASMMTSVLSEPSTTYAVLSALMKPAVPFYIVLNSALELVLVSLIVVWNWEAERKRRTLLLIGVLAYLAMRVWTYLVFAEARLETAQQPLTAADVAWFKQTLATDFRIGLNVITYLCFLLAAFVPASPRPEQPPVPAGRGQPVPVSQLVPQQR